MATLNGATAHPYRVRHPASPAIDPMTSVLSMGLHVPTSVIVAVLVAFTIVFHGGVAAAGNAAALFSEIPAWNRGIREAIAFKLAQSYEVEIEKQKEEPPPPPPPEPEPEKEEPKPVAKEVPKDEPPPPPPAPAEAAKVIATDPDPNVPADMTDTIVQGNADKYAGGQTASNGTSKNAVTNGAASPTGVPGGTGTAPAPPPAPKVDRSRGASPAGSADWSDCPFPEEANAEQIDQAFVLIQVKVKPDGNPESVKVVNDPGHGFGREARKCAMRKKFTNALDVDGNPIAATTNAFRVRFER